MQPVTEVERQALNTAITQATRHRVTPKQVVAHLRATGATSISETERLANVHSERERQDLWFGHRGDTFRIPPQIIIGRVMGQCHRRIARACNAGILSLWPQTGGEV